MSITKESELVGMKRVSDAVASTLRAMQDYAKPGLSTRQLDDYGAQLLASYGARSAPKLAYGFPGHTCISVNKEFCHGIPSSHTVLKEGDLINIDVSAELDGFWSDNGASFIVGNDLYQHSQLVETSKRILLESIAQIKAGTPIAAIGHYIESTGRKNGYSVIRNLAGHGVGRSLHEAPSEILNYRNRSNKSKFRRNSVVAIETFIATRSTLAITTEDGWTMIGNKGGFMAQHEHTIVVTDGKPLILTAMNGLMN